MATRDLELAKASYDLRDVEASVVAHNSKKYERTNDDDGIAPEIHSGAGDYVKSLVFGGLDGIITTFAIVAAVAGSGLNSDVVILMGIANLLADGISMGLGDYLSEVAENKFVRHEWDREMWETNNYLEGEKQEMIEIYMGKGLSEEDATNIITTMAKYKDFFVDHMLVMELGLLPVDPDEDTWKKGATTFGAFLLFGSVPVWVYIICRGLVSSDTTFIISIVGTLFTIFMLGVCQGVITKQPLIWSGCTMLFNGGLAASVSYIVGYLLEEVLSLG